MTCESVVTTSQRLSPRGWPRRRPSPTRPTPPAAPPEPAHEDLLDERAHRATARAVLHRHAIVDRSTFRCADHGASPADRSPAGRRSTPPYSCQILQVPSVAHHARADRRVRDALLAEQRAVVAATRCPAMMSPQMHWLCERRRRRSPRRWRGRCRSAAARRQCANSSRRRRLPLGTWAMPRQRPPVGAEDLPELLLRRGALPSRVTQRGNSSRRRGYA